MIKKENVISTTLMFIHKKSVFFGSDNLIKMKKEIIKNKNVKGTNLIDLFTRLVN